MKTRIYRLLVNRVPAIRRKYQEARKKADSKGDRVLLLGKLLLWNLEYYFLGGQNRRGECSFPEKKKLLFQESGSFTGMSGEKLLRELSGYDVISFDVFDTLLLRPFSAPTDLFYMMGIEFHYPDFPVLRILAEDQARQKKQKTEGTGEVSLKEIWECLNPLTGIPATAGMAMEMSLEEKYCLGNPYFLPLVKALKKEEKILLAVSDMYLDREFIQKLLEKFYGPVFDRILVSKEEGCSKGEGNLYEKVRNIAGELRTARGAPFKGACSIAHIGDNPHSDILMARKNKIEPFLYPNPQDAGNPRRPFEMSRITGGIYRGLVNLRFHTGVRKYSVFYELGYIYGGLAALGFCQFIHRRARELGIRQVCFLARDGDILKQVYDRLYPGSPTCYLLWSRNVSARLSAERFPFDFFQRFLFQKINQGYTMEKIFASMRLTALTEKACQVLDCKRDSVLTEKRAVGCRDFLLGQWESVTGAYKEEQELAGGYLRKLLSLPSDKSREIRPGEPGSENAENAESQEGLEKIALVDIGWAGSGPLGVEYLLHKTSGPSWQVHTFLAGSSGAPSPDRNSSQNFFFENRMESYFFSQSHNRDLWKFHDLHKKHNLYLELLFTSPSPGFLGFKKTADGEINFLFAPREKHEGEICQIQTGILDFISDYQRYFGEFTAKGRGEISGRDAYAPLLLLLGDTDFQRKLEKAFFWDIRENVE